MVKHPTIMENYNGSLEDLARDIMDLDLHSLSDFVGYLAIEFEEQYHTDLGRNHPKLALQLERTAHSLYESFGSLVDAYQLDILSGSSKENNHIEGYSSSLECLAKEIGSLSYDSVIKFFEEFASGLSVRADKELISDNRKLALYIERTYLSIDEALNSLSDAWDICKPYMG